MIYFTKYAEKKFEILNKHKVFFTREQIEDTVLRSEKISKKGNYLTAKLDDMKVVFDKKAGVKRIIKLPISRTWLISPLAISQHIILASSSYIILLYPVINLFILRG